MSTERQCFHAKPKKGDKVGCKKSAKYRVLMGRGFTIDVCEEHKKGYEGLGYRIVELKTLEVSS